MDTSGSKGIEISEDIFGSLPSQSNESDEKVPIKRFTISNKNGMQVTIISYGAAITSIRVPDGTGKIRDVVLGFDDINEYLRDYAGGYGSAVGRFANFIENGTFTLNGDTFNVGLNHRGHHLHGGAKGFHTKIWEGNIVEGRKVAFSCVSEDGEEGYPGAVLVQAIYELTTDNQVVLTFEAMASKPTPINMTSHGHFNLGGHESADERLVDHVIQINADNYTVSESNGIPNGQISSVEGTNLDFRMPQNLNKILEAFPAGVNGFNVNYCVNPSEEDGKLNFVSRITNTKTKLVMEILSNQPGVQFYTGQHWPDPAFDQAPILGKGGAKYMKYGFFALETQNYPNAVNVATFPSAIVNPGEIYKHTVIYKFTIQ